MQQWNICLHSEQDNRASIIAVSTPNIIVPAGFVATSTDATSPPHDVEQRRWPFLKFVTTSPYIEALLRNNRSEIFCPSDGPTRKPPTRKVTHKMTETNQVVDTLLRPLKSFLAAIARTSNIAKALTKDSKMQMTSGFTKVITLRATKQSPRLIVKVSKFFIVFPPRPCYFLRRT